MDKSCANHPESMALATCKACEKSVCLMCVVDEKEGTFCSSDCHTAFANGEQVPKFVGAATESAASSSGVQKIDSIFDDEPVSAAAPSAGLPTPPVDEAMPIVAEGTKWRPIGAQCSNHSDTPAVANCDRCGKPVCALCLLEATQGTFCSSECLGNVAKQPQAQAATAERAALQGKPVFRFKEPPKSNKGVMVAALLVLLVAGAAGAYYGWNGFSLESFTKPNESSASSGNRVDPPISEPLKPPVTPTLNPETTQKPEITPTILPSESIKPDPPKPVEPETPTYYIPVKPKPAPKIVPTRTLDPWADQEPGAWFRVKTTRGGQVTLTDTGLKEKTKDSFVLVTQTFSNGQASAVTENKFSLPKIYLRGEETFTVEGQSYLCEIRSPGLEDEAPKTWALLSGRSMGAVLKSVTPEGTMTTKTIWEGTWRVDGRPLDCLVVEGQLQVGSTARPIKSWYCSSVPMGLVHQEMGEDSMALISMGFDWAHRPEFKK